MHGEGIFLPPACPCATGRSFHATSLALIPCVLRFPCARLSLEERPASNPASQLYKSLRISCDGSLPIPIYYATSSSRTVVHPFQQPLPIRANKLPVSTVWISGIHKFPVLFNCWCRVSPRMNSLKLCGLLLQCPEHPNPVALVLVHFSTASHSPSSSFTIINHL